MANIGVIAFEIWNYIGFLLIIFAPVFCLLRSRWVWIHASGVTAHLVVFLVVGRFAWVPPGWADGNVYLFLLRNYGDFIMLLFDLLAISINGDILNIGSGFMLILLAGICSEVSFRLTPTWLDTIPTTIVRAAERQAQGRPYCVTLSGGRLARSINDLSVDNLTNVGVEHHDAYAQLNVISKGSWESSLWSFRSLEFIRLEPRSAEYFPARCGTPSGIAVRPDPGRLTIPASP